MLHGAGTVRKTDAALPVPEPHGGHARARPDCCFMSAETFSDTLRALLREHLTSFEQLEIILLLRVPPVHDWTVSAMSDQLRMPRELAEAALAGLVSGGLVRCDPTGAHFRFAPATPALAQAVEDLATAYADRSAAVLSEMSINAIARIRSGPMRAFADSFIFGKKTPNG
jgi:hypothetical protein